MRSWQAADAKQNVGRLVEAAKEEPQMLLKHAEPVGIVLSIEHYDRLKAQADAAFANFLLASPLAETDFDGHVGMSVSGGRATGRLDRGHQRDLAAIRDAGRSGSAGAAMDPA